jgi:hypothetical protein
MIPLSELADLCGLKPTSLNPKAKSIGALDVNGRWFISKQNAQKIIDFYTKTITTTEAAKRLGLNHRASVIHRCKKKQIKYIRLAHEYRIIP